MCLKALRKVDAKENREVPGDFCKKRLGGKVRGEGRRWTLGDGWAPRKRGRQTAATHWDPERGDTHGEAGRSPEKATDGNQSFSLSVSETRRPRAFFNAR